MKKLLVIMLSLVMALTVFTACGQKEETTEESSTLTVGILSLGGAVEEDVNKTPGELLENTELVFYDDLNSMLLSLQSGKINRIGRLPLSCAKYIVARNEGLDFIERNEEAISYHIGLSEKNEQAYTILNDAITSMKDDGTLDKLREEYIEKYTEGNSEPATAEMPHFDGADTLKIAVTGDVPPLDLVDADGNPAGYNVAVLAEIAKRSEVNIELVPMNSGSRFAALSSGTVDAIFIVNKSKLEGDKSGDCPEGVTLVGPFYEDKGAAISRK